eukprot:Hpha_TRINITY_DN12824_c0_g1::TRINITY_DN12824_c0_g1_i1::g.24348::m.24348
MAPHADVSGIASDAAPSPNPSPRHRRRRQNKQRRDKAAATARVDEAMRALDEAKNRAKSQKEEYGKYLRWKVRMQWKERRQRQREVEEQHKRRESRLLSILQEHRQQRRAEQRRWEEFRKAPVVAHGGGKLEAPPPLERPSLGQMRHEQLMQEKRLRAQQSMTMPASSPQRPDGPRPRRAEGEGRRQREVQQVSGTAAAGLTDKISFEDLVPFLTPGSGLEGGGAKPLEGDAAPAGRVQALDHLASEFTDMPLQQQRECAARAEQIALQPQLQHRLEDSRMYIETMRSCIRHGRAFVQRRQEELLPRVCSLVTPPQALLRRVNVLSAFLNPTERTALATELTRDGCMPPSAGFTSEGGAQLVPPGELLEWRRERTEYMQETARLRRAASLARMERDPPADYLMTDDLTRYIPAEFLTDRDVTDPIPHKRKEQEFFLTAVGEQDDPAFTGALQPAHPPAQPGGKKRPGRAKDAWSWMPKVPQQLLAKADEGEGLEETKARRELRERADLSEYLDSMTERYVPPLPRLANRTEYHGKDYRWQKQDRHTLIQVPGRTLALTAPPAPRGRL